MKASVQERAAGYLDRMEPAIQGQRGSVDAFKAAIVLVHGFALDPETGLRLFLEHYNPKCLPPWSESEARHKIRSALKAGANRPRGHLLGDGLSPVQKSSRLGSRTPTKEECQQIARLRNLPGPGCWLAAQLGVLRVGKHRGQLSWGISDQGGPIAAARRMDGGLYQATSAKTDTLVRGEHYHKPYGFIPGLPNVRSIALFEGLPDFLAGWEQVLWESQIEALSGDPYDFGDLENAKEKLVCLPLAMLATGARISASSRRWFKGKKVWIFIHNEEAGEKAARKWSSEIGTTATKVVGVKCGALINKPGADFNDCFNKITERIPL